MKSENIKTVAVHNGSFHADDVFAVAILMMLYPELEIVRTRDEKVLSSADLRIDVGGKYDPENGDFDHHLPQGVGERDNGIPYASCGLIWKHYGMRLVSNEFEFNHVDKKIIQSVDAVDCGYSLGEELLKHKHYDVSDVVDAYNPPWYKEDVQHDLSFREAVIFAKTVLRNEIEKVAGFEKASDYVMEVIKRSGNSRYIVLEKYCPWQSTVVENSNIEFVIFPSTTGEWRVRAVPQKLGSFFSRKLLPREWSGKRNSELALITGVSDAEFCHPACFIAGAVSREGAVKMAEIAIRTSA